MKKFLSIILSVFMIASILGTITLADSGSANVKFTVDKTNAVVGDTVTVTISNDEMTVSSFTCGIKFDKDKLECTFIKGASTSTIKVSYQGEEETETQNLSKSTVSEANEAGTIGMYFTGTEDVKYYAGVLSQITFTVKAEGDTSITLYEDSDGTDGFRSNSIESKTITLTSTPSHTHSWSTTWSKNDTYHWHECTATGCDVTENSGKNGYATHIYDQAVVNSTYLASAATCTTPATYYKSCVCGASSTAAATFTNGSTTPHNLSSTYQSDKDGHWQKCTNDGCTYTTPKANHSSSGANVATCRHKAKCDACNVEYGAVAEHTWSDSYLKENADSSKHYHVCTVCNIKDAGENHIKDRENATETEPIKCTKCEWVIQEALGHHHNLTKTEANPATCTEAGNIEYWTCSGCNKKFRDADGTAEITESVTTAALGHTPGNWQSDNDNHWKVCETCQAELNKAHHSYADGSNTCETCQHVREVTPPPTDTVKVIFDANGGNFSDGSTEKEITGETAVAIADCREDPTRDNYRFDGWYTSATGGTQLTPNDNYSQNITVYAHWTYIGGDGSISIITRPDSDNNGTKENPGTGAAPGSIGYVFVGLAAVGALCFGAKKFIKKDEE